MSQLSEDNRRKDRTKSLADALRLSRKVIYEGLINPNKFNAPRANAFKDAVFGMFGGIPGSVGDVSAALEAADLWKRGEKAQAALAGVGALPLIPSLANLPVHLGTISPGGSKDIMLGHEMNMFDLDRMLVEPRQELKRYLTRPATRWDRTKYAQRLVTTQSNLQAPSISVAKRLFPFGNEYSDLQVFPNPNLLDPAVNPRSALYPRDIYAYRRGMPGEPPYTRKGIIGDPRLTEGYTPNSYSQIAAILAGNRFPSFKDFETSPEGAQALTPWPAIDYSQLERQTVDALKGWIEGKLRQPGELDPYTMARVLRDVHFGATPNDENIYHMRRVIENFIQDPENADLVTSIKTYPRTYAELKYHGQLPVAAPYITAVYANPRVFPGGTIKDVFTPELINELKRRGIRTYSPELTDEEVKYAVDKLHGLDK